MNDRLFRAHRFGVCLLLAGLIPIALSAQSPDPFAGDRSPFSLSTSSDLATPSGLDDLECGNSGGFKFGFAEHTGTSLFGELCPIVYRCELPKSEAVFIALKDGLCNPATTACEVRLWAPLEFPNNALNFSTGGPTGKLLFYSSPTASSCAPYPFPACGQIAECGFVGATQVEVDFISAWIERGGVTCANAETLTDDFSLAAWQCVTSNVGCRRLTPVNGLILGGPEMAKGIGCRRDIPPDSCAENSNCDRCRVGVGLGDGGPGFAVAGGGPGATFYHRAGGTGSRFTPGEAAWRLELGRSWSHSYAERIVVDPDDSHVWLLTKTGSFREWSVLSGGVYTTVFPSDEKRTLARTAGGWELLELDGTVHAFGTDGRWLSSTDRNGNAKTASYAGGALASVSFPDGRSETFSYHLDGKLASITEVGVGGSPTRIWSYVWSGDDLIEIHRPDSTAWRFRYTASGYPGFVTHQFLRSTSGAERIVQRWSYDREGRVVETWSGDETVTATSPNHWQFSYDDPLEPTVVTVTDPLGISATVNLGRETVSGQIRAKTRITSYSGDCPSCSLGPNSQLQYTDSSNPLRPTRVIDGKGHITDLVYDALGMVTSRTEAVGTAVERSTGWIYHATFPALVESVTRPSTAGAPSERETTTGFDAFGNPTTRTETGLESGSAFSYSTLTTFNAAGQPLTLDPPGHGSADQTSLTYDPARGDLVPLTRTDPIGTSTYAYDGFNRRTSVTDPNGVVTETVYDALDRATTVTVRGAVVAEDLVTRHFYNAFKDLFCTVLPRGNAIEYAYDTAGRMITTTHGTAVASPSATACLNTALPRERTGYTLNGQGQRIREDREASTGPTTWAAHSATAYVYSTRCHLDQVVQAPGTAEEAVTEHAYDCNGNLDRTWDPNHPSAGQTNPATAVYNYDALDRLTTLTQPWGGAGGGNVVTSYGYDVQDHLTAVTDGEGSVTSYVYSDRDLMTSEASPVSGTTTHLYDEHGERVTTTDARGVTMNRTLDPADRVTFVDYPGTDLDTSYTYGTNAAAFDIGRLTGITRPNGTAVPYTYDRFGRPLSDGELTFIYDKNGNRTTIGYPGGTVASYTYDFADRPVSLTATPSGGSAQTVASAASYRARGPLSAVTLGNGAVETRTFDQRYVPTSIQVSGNRLTWDYTTDDVGNPTTISQTLPSAESRTYGYQDFQYFLTSGVGPWGSLSWTYDRIGNRLSETRDALTDSYVYLSNSATPTPGNTASLDRIDLGTLGTRDYAFGPAGHLDQIVAGAVTTDYQHSPEGQLADLGALGARSTMTYDGRSFLRKAEQPAFSIFEDGFESANFDCWIIGGGALEPGDEPLLGPGCFTPAPAISTTATYGSRGLLYSLLRESGERNHVLYLTGRPVAQLKVPAAGAATFTYLTTDHLGTPVLAMNQVGTSLWSGGFEPFGTDWQAGSAAGASESGVFLRLPGQWVDGVWGEDYYYNVARWYESSRAGYTAKDPLGLKGGKNLFAYVSARPLVFVDPKGLEITTIGCNASQVSAIQSASREASEAAPGCVFCKDVPALRKILDNLTVTCDAGDQLYFNSDPCAVSGTRGGGLIPNNGIVIYPGGFEGACGCLKGVILHESLHHLSGGTENLAGTYRHQYASDPPGYIPPFFHIPTVVRRCFGCAPPGDSQ
jgi:RHS repeat-associated protein